MMAGVKKVLSNISTLSRIYLNGVKCSRSKPKWTRSDGWFNGIQRRLFSIGAVDYQFQTINKKLFQSNAENHLCKWCNRPKNIKCRYAYTQKTESEEEELHSVISDEGRSFELNYIIRIVIVFPMWILDVLCRVHVNTSIVMLWENQARRAWIDTKFSKSGKPLSY